jgi:hypothetical protein
MVFTRHSWFAIHRDSLCAAFECDPFPAKVIQSRGKPFLKLPTVDEEPGRPDGPVLVRLPTLLREWLGPDAGLPGTSFEVEFHREGDAWHIAPLSAGKPVAQARKTGSASMHRSALAQDDQHDRFLASLLSSPPPTSRFTTHHRRRLAARPHSAAAAKSGIQADHARAGGHRRPHDRRGVRPRLRMKIAVVALYFRFNNRSYSLWWPIQNQTRSDPSSTATAR